MDALGLLLSVSVSSLLGAAAGFLMGLVPGLHINNLAAIVAAYAAASLAAFGALGGPLDCDDAGLLVSCFLCAALVSHCFSEAVPNTYVGIPSDDAVAVLPAHRLAKAGLGWTAVRASADGSLAGVMLGAASLVPVSFVLGPELDVYAHLRKVMGYLVVLLSAALVLSDVAAAPLSRSRVREMLVRLSKASAVFLTAGLLGFIVLDTNYFASDIPGCTSGFVPRASLLLPLFAGLFGLPTLLLSMGSAGGRGDAGPLGCKVRSSGAARATALSLAGGLLVGWIPGMTSGSSATLCAAALRQPAEEAGDVDSSRRFIWLYSAISTSGAVLSVGALFTILRSRSGVMDAVAGFVPPSPYATGASWFLAPSAIVLSMVLAALLSHVIMTLMRERLVAAGSSLCSKRVAVLAASFVCALVFSLTGLRGVFLLATACSLGLMPPTIGTRRIHLMGCLLVPIAVMFLTW